LLVEIGCFCYKRSVVLRGGKLYTESLSRLSGSYWCLDRIPTNNRRADTQTDRHTMTAYIA